MAPEATRGFRRFQSPASSLHDGLRLGAEVADGNIERRRCVIETDAALIHRPIVLEDVSLAGFPEAESPEDRNGEGLSPTGHGENATIALPLNLRVVRALLKLQVGMLLE